MPDPAPALSATSRRTRLLLGAIVLFALISRIPAVVGISHVPANWDERFITENALRLAFEHRLEPETVYYPAMAHYPLAAAAMVWDAISRGLEAVGGITLYSLRDPVTGHPHFLGTLRIAQGLLGVGTILLIYRIGQRLYGTSCGLLAAALVAASPFHITWSQVLKPPASTTFFAACTVLAAVRLLRTPTLWTTAWAGALVGTTVATAYNGVTAAIPVTLAVLASRLPWGPRLGRLVLAGGASVVAFCVWNPYFVGHPGWYLGTVFNFASGYGNEELLRGLPVIPRLWYLGDIIPRLYLGWGIGWIGFAAVVLAVRDLVGAVVRDRRLRLGQWPHLLPLSFALGHTAATLRMTSLFLPRHFMPMLPFLALLVAVVMERWTKMWLATTGRPRLVRVTLVAVLLAALLLPVLNSHLEAGIHSTAATGVQYLRDVTPGGPAVLTAGFDATGYWGTFAIDQLAAGAADGLLGRGTHLLVPVRTALHQLEPTVAPSALGAILAGPRLRFVALIDRDLPARYGPTVALYRIEVASNWAASETLELPPEGFTLTGDAGVEGDALWLRGPGATAACPAPLDLPLGVHAELLVLAAGDDYSLTAKGTPFGLQFTADRASSQLDILLHDKTWYGSGPLRVDTARPRFGLHYVGPDGGRVYWADCRLALTVPVAEATPEVMAEVRRFELRRALELR